MAIRELLQKIIDDAYVIDVAVHNVASEALRLYIEQTDSITKTLEWMTTQLKWQHEQAFGGDSIGGTTGGSYSPELQTAIDMLAKLKEELQ